MKKIFIGCGSNPLISKEILDETKRVCEYFSKNNFELVYGSYDKGMMGICAHTFLENKKSVYGINLDKYPKSVIDTTQEEYHTSFDRLKRMYELADFFLILPGGTGTYSELFGIMEEFKTNKQGKKLFLSIAIFFCCQFQSISLLESKNSFYIGCLLSHTFLVCHDRILH